MQGDALAAAYIGKWITTAIEVYDVSENVGDFFVQSVLSRELGSMKYLSASFLKDLSENISLIAKGTTITIRGEIRMIMSDRMSLQKCELVQTTPS